MESEIKILQKKYALDKAEIDFLINLFGNQNAKLAAMIALAHIEDQSIDYRLSMIINEIKAYGFSVTDISNTLCFSEEEICNFFVNFDSMSYEKRSILFYKAMNMLRILHAQYGSLTVYWEQKKAIDKNLLMTQLNEKCICDNINCKTLEIIKQLLDEYNISILILAKLGRIDCNTMKAFLHNPNLIGSKEKYNLIFIGMYLQNLIKQF